MNRGVKMNLSVNISEEDRENAVHHIIQVIFSDVI